MGDITEMIYKYIDLHMHSSISDGSDSPAELLKKVKDTGIELFALTDHDDISGCAMIRAMLGDDDPDFISGVEFSCKDEFGKYHILGYGYEPDSDPIRDVVDLGHRYRMEKAKARIDCLRDQLDIILPDNEIDVFFALDNPGKPHLGNLLVKYGYADSKEQAITEIIDRLDYADRYVRPEEAISGILGAGGIPVLAHPLFGSGNQLITGDEMDRRLQRLISFGLKGIEAFYSGFSDDMCDQMLNFASLYDLYITAGSDYHGTNKRIRLGDNGLSPDGRYPEGLIRFMEDVRRCDIH